MESNPSVALVLGGARSGKSAFAERLIGELSAPWVYIATAQAFDDEMRMRIALHRSRRDSRWINLEAPHALAQAIAGAPEEAPVLVDCLTLWLTNIMLGGDDVAAQSEALTRSLMARKSLTLMVASEVGLGIVPDNPLARRFRDAAGLLNQSVARVAGDVYFIVAGLPLRVK